MNGALSSRFQRAGHKALAAGLLGSVLCLAGMIFNPSQFFRSWLVAWIFFGGLSFGTLVIFMIQTLTGGAWGRAIRRLCEAAMMTLPLVGLLFLPIILGAHYLYPWLQAGIAATHPGWIHKSGYLNLPFFIIRAVFYFTTLGTLAFLLRKLSIRSDGPKPAFSVKQLSCLSGGGLVFYVLCMNFASTDWVMSLEPDWYSTIFVVIFMAGQFLSALALMTVLLALFANHKPFAGAITSKLFHDLGNLLLAFVIFWTYVSFSQFLITWAGNLPKEIGWYLHRDTGGWLKVVWLLALFGFFAPVALLLLRSAKRQRGRLAAIAVLILMANLVNVYWLVMPAFSPEQVRLHWLDFAALIAIGGLWTGTFLWILNRQPLLPREIEEEKSA